jgi:hypothetical protein
LLPITQQTLAGWVHRIYVADLCLGSPPWKRETPLKETNENK